ncbi:MAG: hypothetical protein KDG56_17935, partial [Ottowia sp.]|nr:hypothetical protein [Ottowia sp.]
MPIEAPGAVQTGCLHQERKGDWCRFKPVPSGLRPERAIAGVASLGKVPTLPAAGALALALSDRNASPKNS